MMKTNNIVMAIAGAALLLSACAKDEPNAQAQQGSKNKITVTAGGFTSATAPAALNAPSTRAEDVAYTTTFVSGDAIGIIVVEDGELLHDNLICTYDGTDWALGEGVALYLHEDADYIAYYPYAEAMDGKKSTDEILAAFSPKADQSAYADYTASDLMLWSGAPTGNGSEAKLDISLSHAMAMIIIVPGELNGGAISDVTITAETDDTTYSAAYAMKDEGNTTVAGGAATGTPDGTYRLLVKPGDEIVVDLTYKSSGATLGWDNADAPLTPTAAKYTRYTITPSVD